MNIHTLAEKNVTGGHISQWKNVTNSRVIDRKNVTKRAMPTLFAQNTRHARITEKTCCKHKVLSSEWHLGQAYVLCTGNLRYDADRGITYLPLYMTMFLEPERLPDFMPLSVDLSALNS